MVVSVVKQSLCFALLVALRSTTSKLLARQTLGFLHTLPRQIDQRSLASDFRHSNANKMAAKFVCRELVDAKEQVSYLFTTRGGFVVLLLFNEEAELLLSEASLHRRREQTLSSIDDAPDSEDDK